MGKGQTDVRKGGGCGRNYGEDRYCLREERGGGVGLYPGKRESGGHQKGRRAEGPVISKSIRSKMEIKRTNPYIPLTPTFLILSSL